MWAQKKKTKNDMLEPNRQNAIILAKKKNRLTVVNISFAAKIGHSYNNFVCFHELSC